MEFSLTQEQQAVQGLANRIFTEQSTHERLSEVEAGPGWDRALWTQLAEAGLLGLFLPEAIGGAGLGLAEVGLLLEESGRATAAIPLLALAVGALPLARFEAQRFEELLNAAAAGDRIVTAALSDCAMGPPTETRSSAEPMGDHWQLNGSMATIPWASIADVVLVPAECPDGDVYLFAIETALDGVEMMESPVYGGLSWGEVKLDDVRVPDVGRLADPRAVNWSWQASLVAISSLQVGVATGALDLTASYTAQREQFGRPIATFQGVATRAADAFIDTEIMTWTARQAAWRIDQDLASDVEAGVAKFWAAEGGHRVVSASQHLHGGIGVDMDYPLHRHYLLATQLDVVLGGSHRQLERIAQALASGSATATTGTGNPC